MSRFIYYSSIFFGLVLFSNNILANYNEALDSYNNKNWIKSLKTCESNFR